MTMILFLVWIILFEFLLLLAWFHFGESALIFTYLLEVVLTFAGAFWKYGLTAKFVSFGLCMTMAITILAWLLGLSVASQL